MKKFQHFLFLLPLFILSAGAQAKINIVTTTEDLAALAREVGGEHVQVQSIAKGYQDPHFVDAKPSYLLQLKRADLFIQVGLELEAAWAPALVENARNKKILPGNPGFLDASRGCEIIQDAQAADRSQGDIHPFGNPHYWLDPDNGRIIAENITSRLEQIDPANAGSYQKHLEAFKAALAVKELEWAALAKSWKGLEVVTYHNSWPNFARRFGLEVVNFIEPKPGIPPAPFHVGSLIDQIQRENIPLILIEPYFDPKLPEKVARDSGAKVLIIAPSVGARESIKTYFDLFDYNLRLLEKNRPVGQESQ